MKLLLLAFVGVFFSSINVCIGKNGTTVGEAKTFSLDSLSLPSIPSISLDSSSVSKPSFSLDSFSKPTLPTPDISGITSIFSTDVFGDFNLFQLLDSFVLFKNRIPNFVANFGNYSLLQATLLLALGGLVAGVALLIAEAWSFKHEEDQEYYFKHRVPHFDYYSPSPSQYGVPQSSQYGPPSTSYGQPNRRQDVDSQNTQQHVNYNKNGLKPQQRPTNQVNGRTVDRSHSVPGTVNQENNSYLRFPTFNIDKKKKIMFG